MARTPHSGFLKIMESRSNREKRKREKREDL